MAGYTREEMFIFNERDAIVPDLWTVVGLFDSGIWVQERALVVRSAPTVLQHGLG